MKEKILEAIKNFGGNEIGAGEFSALAEFIHSQIADGLGAATIGSETGKPQLSDVSERDKEAGWISVKQSFPEEDGLYFVYFRNIHGELKPGCGLFCKHRRYDSPESDIVSRIYAFPGNGMDITTQVEYWKPATPPMSEEMSR